MGMFEVKRQPKAVVAGITSNTESLLLQAYSSSSLRPASELRPARDVIWLYDMSKWVKAVKFDRQGAWRYQIRLFSEQQHMHAVFCDKDNIVQKLQR